MQSHLHLREEPFREGVVASREREDTKLTAFLTAVLRDPIAICQRAARSGQGLSSQGNLVPCTYLAGSIGADDCISLQYHVTYDIRKFADEFAHLKNGESDKSKMLQLAGRIYVRRSAGSKLYFYDLRSDV